ncbi:MAG: hypothetical protein WKF88_02840 [Ferruginibacter sp.]
MSNHQDAVSSYEPAEGSPNQYSEPGGGNLFITYLLIALNVLVFIFHG